MRSFAKPENQAAKIVTKAIALGRARHGQQSDGLIHSAGTARAYESALTQAARWSQQGDGIGLKNWTTELAIQYLIERAEAVTQKTLDLDRQALQILPGVTKLERIKSELPIGRLAQAGRAYTTDQVNMISERQQAHNQLATEIVAATGIRAHELLTLRPAAEQPASAHRTWSAERFSGRDGMRYTVAGKGGLIREIMMPTDLAKRLETYRRSEPVRVTDRRVEYLSHYRLGGGSAWSTSFSKVSRSELGWSRGGHGLRHAYAQNRMEELQSRGQTYPAALEIVSQELGHFRPDITEVYLR